MSLALRRGLSMGKSFRCVGAVMALPSWSGNLARSYCFSSVEPRARTSMDGRGRFTLFFFFAGFFLLLTGCFFFCFLAMSLVTTTTTIILFFYTRIRSMVAGTVTCELDVVATQMKAYSSTAGVHAVVRGIEVLVPVVSSAYSTR